MKADIYIGMGGWDLPSFDKLFYPAQRYKHFRKLEYYSHRFNSVEINATFYSTALTAGHARRWLEDVSANREFVFTIKLFRGFTHTFEATNDDVRAVRRVLDVLAAEGKLGGLLMQFPYHFTNLPERLHYVRHLGRVFAPYRMFTELRHLSWDTRQTRDALHEQGLHVVNVDLPRIKRHIALGTEAWNGASYFRMMGRNAFGWMHPEEGERYRYFYSEDEMEQLAGLVTETATTGTKTFVVFHNDPDARSIVNGFQLQKKLHRTPCVSRPASMELPFAA